MLTPWGNEALPLCPSRRHATQGFGDKCGIPLAGTVQLKKGSGKGWPYCFTEGKDTSCRVPSPDSLCSGWGRGGGEAAGKRGLGKGQFPICYRHFIVVVVAAAVVMETSEPPSPLSELE